MLNDNGVNKVEVLIANAIVEILTCVTLSKSLNVLHKSKETATEKSLVSLRGAIAPCTMRGQ